MSDYNDYSKQKPTRKLRKGRIIVSDEAAISHQKLRRMLGYLGILLPLSLFLVTMSKREDMLPSISDYFYTELRILFIGILVTISVFLFNNCSTNKLEKYISKISAFCAILVIVFPTPPQKEYIVERSKTYTYDFFDHLVQPTIPNSEFVGTIHFVAAATFFILLSILVLKVFIEEEKEADDDPNIKIIIYRICFWGMILPIVCIFLGKIGLFPNADDWQFPLTLAGETIALISFSMAWLVKGDVDLKLDEMMEELKNND